MYHQRLASGGVSGRRNQFDASVTKEVDVAGYQFQPARLPKEFSSKRDQRVQVWDPKGEAS